MKAALQLFRRSIAGWKARVGKRGNSAGGQNVAAPKIPSYGEAQARMPEKTEPGTPVQLEILSRGDVLKVATGAAGAAILLPTMAPEALASGPSSNFATFSGPARIYANGSVAAGSVVGPIDATVGGVPAGATAAWCAVQSQQTGVMTLYPDGTSDPGIANWTGTGTSGVLNMMYMMVPLSPAGKFWFHTYFTGSVYIDVWGYLS